MLLCSLSLISCNGAKYSEKVICEVKSDDLILKMIEYKRKSYNIPIGRVSSPDETFGSVYLEYPNNKWRNRRLFEKRYDGFEGRAKELCESSSVKDGIIVVHPAPRHFVLEYRIDALDRNGAIISADGGSSFELIFFPEKGYPYLLDSKGKSLVYPSWITRDISAESARVKLTQVTFMTAPFYDSSGEKLIRKDLMEWLALRGKNCDECGPALFRDVESIDGGKTWKITNYGVLRPDLIPKDAQPLLAKNVYWFHSHDLTMMSRGARDPNEGKMFDCPVDTSQLDDFSKKVCGLSGKVIHLK